MNKRFEGTNKRFEATNKRFEATNKRFEGTNKRFVETNKRFEATNKRFVEANKRRPNLRNSEQIPRNVSKTRSGPQNAAAVPQLFFDKVSPVSLRQARTVGKTDRQLVQCF
jgi:hypothetical protein